MAGDGAAGGLTVPKSFVVAPSGTSLLELRVPKAAKPGPLRVEIPYSVSNVKVGPVAGLPFAFAVEVEVLPPLAK
jgi:hypothetical protein